MKTEKEINQSILEITMKIRNEYPELIKYLSEMPVTIPDVENPEMTIKVLTDYYESLKNIVEKYISSHK
jgi:hypothetical protein